MTLYGGRQIKLYGGRNIIFYLELLSYVEPVGFHSSALSLTSDTNFLRISLHHLPIDISANDDIKKSAAIVFYRKTIK